MGWTLLTSPPASNARARSAYAVSRRIATRGARPGMGRGERIGTDAAGMEAGAGAGVERARYAMNTVAARSRSSTVARDLSEAGAIRLREMRVNGFLNRIRSVVIDDGSESACRIPSSELRNSSAVPYRSPGVFAMAFKTTRSREAGMEGATVRRGFGVVESTW